MTTIDDLIGFGSDPETPVWLAARRDRAACAVLAETVPAELGPESKAEFAATLAERGLDVTEFQLIAVDRRQWSTRLVTRCAAELARRNLVLLGAAA